MKRFILIFLTLLLLFPLGAKGEKETPILPSGRILDTSKRFRIVLPKSEDRLFLNPVEATDASSLLLLEGLYEGLYSLDPQTGDPIKALAKEVKVSQDGLKWTFTLDERGRFSNGEPITAQVIIDSWFNLLNNAGGETYLTTLLDAVEGVNAFRQGSSPRWLVGITAPNAATIEMRLNYPASYLPALLATLPFAAIYPKESKELITSGAYEIVEESSDKIVLAKNFWYRDWDGVKSDFIEISFLRSEELVEAYSNNLVDWSVAYLPPQSLKHIGDLRLGIEYSTGFYYFSSRQEAYRDSRVRRALALLIPWDELRSESHQIFPTPYLIPDIERPSLEEVPVNLSEAYNLLAEAGYPYGAGLPQLNMAIHKGAGFAESGEKIANIWSRALGITVTLDVVPLGMYSRFPALSPYDFSFITWVGDFHDPLSFLLLFSSESEYNLANYESEEYDALLRRAMAATEGERNAHILDAEKFLFDEAVVFPLFHGLTTNIIDHQRVRGWYDNPLDNHPLKYLYTLTH